MFEPKVENYILQDALKIALARYLKNNEQEVGVRKGNSGKKGKCIKNSLKYDKSQVAIGFCVFEGKSIINTIDIIVHAINYDKFGYIDNTNLKDYKFYVIKIFHYDMTKDLLYLEMCEISNKYKKLAIKELEKIYDSIRIGNFKFD